MEAPSVAVAAEEAQEAAAAEVEAPVVEAEPRPNHAKIMAEAEARAKAEAAAEAEAEVVAAAEVVAEEVVVKAETGAKAEVEVEVEVAAEVKVEAEVGAEVLAVVVAEEAAVAEAAVGAEADAAPQAAEAETEDKEVMAVRLQSRVRGTQARRATRRKRKQRTAEEGIREGAATKMQARTRGVQQRRAAREKGQAVVDEDWFGGSDESESDESQDSDFDHDFEAPPEAAWPQGLQGLVSMAKLYGSEEPPPPGFALESDVRRLLLDEDALWHREEPPEEGEVPGRIALAQVKSCQLTQAGELVVVSEGKCHVLSAGPDPSASMQDWYDQIEKHRAA